jgi:hypothetical protein
MLNTTRSTDGLAFIAVACLAAVLGSPGAMAADKTKATPPVKKDAILTPDQLRDCVAQKAKRDSVLKTKAEIASDKAEIDRTGTSLADDATSLDRTNVDAVNAYNARVDERDKRIETYQAKVASYNKEAEDVLAGQDAYDRACGNRRYDDRDLADIQKESQKKGKK